MANYKVFSVRLRHEWLAKPKRKKRIKRRAAKRIGLFDTWQRKGKQQEPEAAAESVEEQPAE